MYRIAVICVLACTGAWAVSGQESTTFREFLVTDPPPVTFGDAALVDFDLDGDLDLILTGLVTTPDDPLGSPHAEHYSNDGETAVEVLTPTGDTEEVPAVDFAASDGARELVPVWKSAVAAADFNGDSYPDVAVSGINSDGHAILYVYRNTRSSTDRFASRFLLEGLHSGDLGWGDSDNDGDFDLAACGYTDSGGAALRLYVNEGTQMTVSGGQTAFTGVGYCSLEWGDYDTDGDMDILVAGVDDGGNFQTFMYDNNGSGRFTKAGYHFEGFAWPAVAFGDLDVDGDLDVLISGARLTPMMLEGVVKVYRNEGGSFVDASDLITGLFDTDLTPGRYDGSVGWADYENSGYPGFAITGAESPFASETTQLYKSARGGSLMKSSVDDFDGGIRGSAIWGDYDSDLDIDLLIFGEAPIDEATTIKVMTNDLLYGLRAPQPPSVASADVSGRSVSFSWSGASDRQTPEAGLTYNLRVGMTPGGSQVLAAMADPETGVRRISWRGNVGHNTTWTLRDLEPGTYYWGVQSLDQTYSGSPFTVEQSFTVSN